MSWRIQHAIVNGVNLKKMTFRQRELALDSFKMNLSTLPIETSDPLNARILAVSEDRVQGFQRDPLGEIARQSGVELSVVIERIQAMLRAGTVRRVRLTLLATNLAQGALECGLPTPR